MKFGVKLYASLLLASLVIGYGVKLTHTLEHHTHGDICGYVDTHFCSDDRHLEFFDYSFFPTVEQLLAKEDLYAPFHIRLANIHKEGTLFGREVSSIVPRGPPQARLIT